MLPNGLVTTLELALAGPRRGDRSFNAALILGMFREDVIFVPLLGFAVPSPSLRHIWPRSRHYCQSLHDTAVRLARAGERLNGAYQLGRAIHVLIDMACPAHAQAVPHYLRDPFERYIDAHAAELAELPVPDLPHELVCGSPATLVESLARAAQAYPVHHRTTRASLAAQAKQLVPLAAGHVRALVAAFESKVSA